MLTSRSCVLLVYECSLVCRSSQGQSRSACCFASRHAFATACGPRTAQYELQGPTQGPRPHMGQLRVHVSS
eukprot:3008454-Prymnesium_polylepis.3